ncbi:MAG: ornithine cyclodeaminase family protein, partial [Pseudolabrys sp.]
MARRNATEASGAILILSSKDLQTVMRFDDYVDAVAEAFRMLAEGRCESPVPLQVSVTDGTFHAKAASLPVGPGYVAVKVNGNFPDNRSRHGLPTIQGAVFLADANNGRPLALLDSIEITRQRTAAATAVATQYLARPDSRTATICGCGEQGRIQLMALRHKLDLTQVFAWDIDSQISRRFSAEMAELGITVTAIDDLREGTLVSDAIVTCTSSHKPFLGFEDVRPGTFVAAVGADNPQKSEIKPELMAKAAVIVDVLQQSIVMGDMHHAINAGVMTPSDVRAELGTLIAQHRPGRLADDEITIFDSSGTGVQDVAAAARAYELARNRDLGLICAL